MGYDVIVVGGGSVGCVAAARLSADDRCCVLLRAAGPDYPVGFQKSATGPDMGFYAARSYSLRRPPGTGRCLIRSWERPATE